MGVCPDHHRLRVRFSNVILLVPVCLLYHSNGITALSFSYDGEFIAIASTGSYIDIVSNILFLCRSVITYVDVVVRNRDWAVSSPDTCIRRRSNSPMAPFETYYCILWPNSDKRERATSGRLVQFVWSWYVRQVCCLLL